METTVAASVFVTTVAAQPAVAPAGDAAVDAAGQISGLGGATTYGSLSPTQLAASGAIVSIVATPDAKGYYLVSKRGDVVAFGDAHGHRSLIDLRSSRSPRDIVGMALTPDGNGYWLVSAAGSVYSFGDANFYGSAAGKLGASGEVIVAIAPTPDGKGYWLVSNFGGVHTFGDAHDYGNLVGIANTVTAFALTPDGRGYWLVTEYGAAYPFGDARNYGNAIHVELPGEIVGIAVTRDGKGYYLLGATGIVYHYGDAAVATELKPSPFHATAITAF